MKLSSTIVIGRPLEEVWDFCVVNHSKNHPRWDEHITLEDLTQGEIRVGFVMRRTNTRYGQPVTGTQTVTGIEEGKKITFRVEEGPSVTTGGIELERIDEGKTALTRWFEGSDEYKPHEEMLKSRLEEVGIIIKELLESQ